MGDFIKYFLIATLLFCLLDYLWLGKVANKFYRDNLVSFLAKKPNLRAAVVFYILFIIGLLVFAVTPARHQSQPILQAVRLGALYGFFTYCTYDLTNLATLKAWPVKLAVVDIAWGTILAAAVAGLTAFLAF